MGSILMALIIIIIAIIACVLTLIEHLRKGKLIINATAQVKSSVSIHIKIKKYCEKVNDLVDFVNSITQVEYKQGASLKGCVNECLEKISMENAYSDEEVIIMQQEIAEKTKKYIAEISKLDTFKGNMKYKEKKENLDKLQKQLNISIEKYKYWNELDKN